MFDQDGQLWGRDAGGRPALQKAPLTVVGVVSVVSVPWLLDAVRALYPELSPKEQAVILAAARGAEDKEIAAELRCTLSTVRTLWQRSYKKMHTSSRRRLIAALWNKACQLATCHFLNDVTVPLESVKVEGLEPLAGRDSRDQQVK